MTERPVESTEPAVTPPAAVETLSAETLSAETPPAETPASETLSEDALVLGYRDLSERLGVSVDGARALARRRGWPVSHDTAGRALVHVSASDVAHYREGRAVADGSKAADHRSMAARVAEMVAAIKAEPLPGSAPFDRGAERAEREKLIELMRQFLGMYERERVAWFGTMGELSSKIAATEAQMRAFEAAREQERAHWDASFEEIEATLAAAREAARVAGSQHEEAVTQHRRALADLTIMHNDERSLWLLERRRLEARIEALEDARVRPTGWRWRPAALVRAAGVALMVGLAGTALVRDSGPRSDGSRTTIERSEEHPEDVPNNPARA